MRGPGLGRERRRKILPSNAKITIELKRLPHPVPLRDNGMGASLQASRLAKYSKTQSGFEETIKLELKDQA